MAQILSFSTAARRKLRPTSSQVRPDPGHRSVFSRVFASASLSLGPGLKIVTLLSPQSRADGLKMGYAANGMLGKGLYGAPDPRKSEQFCKNSANGKFMFVCRMECRARTLVRDSNAIG